MPGRSMPVYPSPDSVSKFFIFNGLLAGYVCKILSALDLKQHNFL